MATRPGFYIDEGKVQMRNANFEWAGGFAVSQKQKNVKRLHSALGKSCLEISTKSLNPLGYKLSAYNLKLKGFTLENIFQSSKVFENGGPYLDLLNVNPTEAKRDERLKTSGKIIFFYFENYNWELIPRTAFYDYIYCKAVKESIYIDELKEIVKYEYFTDIEFNPNKSINTQARAIAIVKLLLKMFGEIPELNPEEFVQFHKRFVI